MRYILLAVVMAAIWCSAVTAADDSCWCAGGNFDAGGYLIGDNAVFLYALTSGATGGNPDSVIFWARNKADGNDKSAY